MRKYQQLLLIIVSVFSLSLLLVYRHEYNRLHYVLEVFNFFGQPCNFSELIDNGNLLNMHDWGPEPGWIREDNVLIYSTHQTGENSIVSLAVKASKLDHPRNCYLWFEDNEWQPQIGKLDVSLIKEDSSYGRYRYQCSWTRRTNGLVPYAVSHSKTHQNNAIQLIVPLHQQGDQQFNITLCILPSKFVTRRFLAEFISFHLLVGVDSFILYGNYLPHKSMKLITNLSRKLRFNMTVYPYNYPERIFEDIINEDCRLRTQGQSKFAITLDVNELIVPEINLFSALLSKHPGFKLPVQEFCINRQLEQKPIAIQNLQATRSDEQGTKVIHTGGLLNATKIKTELIDQVISIHKYVYCLKTNPKSFKDGTILKYSDDFIKSTLYQLYLKRLL